MGEVTAEDVAWARSLDGGSVSVNLIDGKLVVGADSDDGQSYARCRLGARDAVRLGDTYVWLSRENITPGWLHVYHGVSPGGHGGQVRVSVEECVINLLVEDDLSGHGHKVNLTLSQDELGWLGLTLSDVGKRALDSRSGQGLRRLAWAMFLEAGYRMLRPSSLSVDMRPWWATLASRRGRQAVPARDIYEEAVSTVRDQGFGLWR